MTRTAVMSHLRLFQNLNVWKQ